MATYSPMKSRPIIHLPLHACMFIVLYKGFGFIVIQISNRLMSNFITGKSHKIHKWQPYFHVYAAEYKLSLFDKRNINATFQRPDSNFRLK